jgi:hypothetical protein
LSSVELIEKREEDERDEWFNQVCPMIPTRKTWREKCLARKENGTDSDSCQGATEETKGPGAEGSEENAVQSSGKVSEVNMVFTLPAELWAPECAVAKMNLGAERAVFERPAAVGEHMKLLYIKGHLDGKPVGRMMVDGGASVNIMPLVLFEKSVHGNRDLKQTNMSLSGF